MKKLSELHEKADAAMKKAIQNVVKQHKVTGRPLAVWKNGKTTLLNPNEVN